MPRLPEIDPATTSGYVAAMLKAQAETFGAPLNNHLLYAYRPDFFKAARGMWSAIMSVIRGIILISPILSSYGACLVMSAPRG